MPLLALAGVIGIFRSADSGHDARAFLLMEAIIFLGYSGLVISIFPNIVPPTLSIWAASAPRSSQIFVLVGTVIILPIIAMPLVVTSLSNIIQIISKKKRSGKKVFLVAPLHHHFEAIGCPAYKVTMRYWVLGVMFAILGLVLGLLG